MVVVEPSVVQVVVETGATMAVDDEDVGSTITAEL
jgi:hypothetical protein